MIENSQLLELIGETRTENLLNDITKQYLEIKNKVYPPKEICNSVSIITITDPKETEIKGIGMSCLNDLLNDNYGKFLGSFLSNASVMGLIGITGGGGGARFYDVARPYNDTASGSIGTQAQVGKGLTPATGQDLNIENPFTVGLEANRRNTGNGAWNSGLGQISVATLISPTTGSGAISEAGLFGVFDVFGGVGQTTYLLSHDNISPVVNFINAQSINIDYKLVFN